MNWYQGKSEAAPDAINDLAAKAATCAAWAA
jgi:hypothetical protein